MRSLSRTFAGAALALCAMVATASPSTSSPQRSDPDQVALRSTAMVGGVWCGAGLLRDFTLEIVQRYQQVEGRLVRRGKVREITGRVEGAVVRTDPQRDHTMELLAQGDELRIIGATGMLALATGQTFTRAAGASCTH